MLTFPFTVHRSPFTRFQPFTVHRSLFTGCNPVSDAPAVSAATDRAALIEQLLDPARHQALLIRAVNSSQERYQTDPSEAHLRALKAAKEELASVSAPPSTAPAAGPEPDLNGTQAVAYLREQCYKVAKSKFYEDAASGKLGKTRAGRFALGALEAYGKAHCKPLAGVANRDDRMAKLIERKLLAETLAAEAVAELKAIQAKFENGTYVEASTRDQYLALRLQRLKDDTAAAIQTHAARKIELVGGDPARLPDLIAYEQTVRAAWLAGYAAEATQGRPWAVPAEPRES